MSIHLWVSTIILGIACAFVVNGMMKNEGGYIAFGIVLFVLDLIFGFGIACGCTSIKEVSNKVENYQIAQTVDHTVLILDGKTYSYNDVATFNKVKSGKFSVNVVKRLNSYNIENERYITITD